MEYFFYCRDRDGSGPLRDELIEDHWSFMDGYADTLIARGPTLTPDDVATGSVHIVDLPDPEAARVFAYEEPNYRAGIYDQVTVRRWSNLLGRTMWEYPSEAADPSRFLVIAHADPAASPVSAELTAENDAYLTEGEYRDALIVAGPLFAEDGTTWLGTTLMAEVPDQAAAGKILAESPYGRAGLYSSVEVHIWTFGGRR